MTEVEYEDELEYEDDVGTMASKEKRADEIVSLSNLEQSLSFFNRNRPRTRPRTRNLSDSGTNN
jgi:hypothetical protein